MAVALLALAPIAPAGAAASRTTTVSNMSARAMAVSSPAAQRAETAGLNAAAACKAMLPGKTGIAGSGDLACFFAPITAETAAQFLALDLKNGATIVVQSGGGNNEAALDMADRLLNIQATVVVWKLCFSACANWLFPAARWKIVLPQASVGWHGGPEDPAQRPDYAPSMRVGAQAEYARSNAFFARIGVNPALIYDPPKGAITTQANRATTGWGLPVELIEGYGVRGILYYWQAPTGERSAWRGYSR